MTDNTRKSHDVSNPSQRGANKIKNELETSIDKIYRGLVEEVDDVLGRMPESVFVRYYLPRFFSPNDYNDNWRSTYIAAAGSPSSPLIIHRDSDPERKILFYAPPYFSSTRISSINQINQKHQGTEIEDVFAQARLFAVNNPTAGEEMINRYLEASYKKRMHSIAAAKEESARVWAWLYLRYGLVTVEQIRGKQQFQEWSDEDSVDSLFD